MSNEKYHVFKLNNGEDVICKLIKTTDEHYEISDPMKMDLFSKHGPKGFMETLGLSRWLQPFTDETVHKIPSDSVTLRIDASIGLGRYYEYVVAKMDNMKSEDWGKLPSPEQLLADEMPSDAFDEYDSTEEWQDLYGDLLRKKTIH